MRQSPAEKVVPALSQTTDLVSHFPSDPEQHCLLKLCLVEDPSVMRPQIAQHPANRIMSHAFLFSRLTLIFLHVDHTSLVLIGPLLMCRVLMFLSQIPWEELHSQKI